MHLLYILKLKCGRFTLIIHFLLGLGSILFAITVDSPELNVVPPNETKSLRKSNEIIIAVPTVCSTTPKERKSIGIKPIQIISFEDDESEQSSSNSNNNNLSNLTSPSLSETCLKYTEKEKQEMENSQTSDSAYERNTNCTEPIAVTPKPNETDYIEPESPTSIKLYSPVLSSKTYPMTSHLFDFKETDSTISKTTDSSSIASTTTTTSSTSAIQQPVSSHPSRSESLDSSFSSTQVASNGIDTNLRVQELEERCASLEEQVTTLTL